MKYLLMYPFLMVSTMIFGQTPSIDFSFPGTSHAINEVYSADNKGHTIRKLTLKVKRNGNAIPSFDLPFQIVDIKVTAKSSDYRVINNRFYISATDFNTKGNEFEFDVFIELKNDDEKADSGDEVFTLKVVPDLTQVSARSPYSGNINAGNPVHVTIKDAPKEVDSFDPFRITVGANFDFEKTVDASLYFDAQMYRPEIWTDHMPLGFYGSLYHNRYLSQDSVRPIDRQFTTVIGNDSIVDLATYDYQIGTTRSIRNIGAEFGLVWGETKKIDNDTHISNTLILPELSAIHRRVNTTYTYERINVDTAFQVPRPDTIRTLIERPFFNYTFDEVLLGAGYLGRFHSKKYGEFMLKATSGLAFQKSSSELDLLAYYAFRFQLIDPTAGINLGGEVRGYITRPNPYFAVYLSKSFGLKKLTSY